MPSRRVVLQAFGVGAVASASLGASTVAAAASSSRDRLWSTEAAPWWLLGSLRAGSAVGRGWRIDDLTPVREGATILSLSHRDGRLARVHICARQGRPSGLAHTAMFDLVLMDGGQGDQQTDEALGRVLKQVARSVARAERTVDEQGLRTVLGLRTHSDRVARYGGEALV